MLHRLYVLVLTAAARWDATRFLTLSVDPGVRRPPEDGTINGKMCNGDVICEAPPAGDEDGGCFRPSEGAHAFPPPFPLAVPHAAIASMRVVPSNILPPVFEAAVALAAIAIDACAITSISLHHLTIFALKR